MRFILESAACEERSCGELRPQEAVKEFQGHPLAEIRNVVSGEPRKEILAEVVRDDADENAAIVLVVLSWHVRWAVDQLERSFVGVAPLRL